MGRGRIAKNTISESSRHEENKLYYERHREQLKAKQKEAYSKKAKEARIKYLNETIAEYDIKVKIKDVNTSGQND